MMNTALTTIEGSSGVHISHWKTFTRKLAIEIGNANPGLIYFLFGKSAQEIKGLIPRRCCSLEWGHPSPQSASNRNKDDARHFIHCSVFSEANNMLVHRGATPINWDPRAPIVPPVVAAAPQIAAAAPPVVAAAAAPRSESAQVCGTLSTRVLDPDDDLVNMDEDVIYAFVDGAARKNGKEDARAGYAVVIIDEFTLYQITGLVAPGAGLPPIAPSNNRAELMAIRDLFAFVASPEFIACAGDKRLHIIYDSEYAAGCVREWYESWCKKPPREVKSNLDIIKVAYEFKNRVERARTVTWEKIKSHLREPSRDDAHEWYRWRGNDLADELASEPLEGG
jgi:ribonuclease HI